MVLHSELCWTKEAQDASTPSRGSALSPSKNSPKTPSHVNLNNRKIAIPMNAVWVKQRLRMYGCYQNDEGALERYPKFKE